jgi:hypothetical protein
MLNLALFFSILATPAPDKVLTHPRYSFKLDAKIDELAELQSHNRCLFASAQSCHG